jgi:membrane protein YdbS with pleckstrin-like domain
MWLRNREGTEPLSARSPLGARRILSMVALVLGVVAGVVFVILAMSTGEQVWRWEAAIAAVVAVVAAVDLAVLRRRRSGGQQRSGGQHRDQ